MNLRRGYQPTKGPENPIPPKGGSGESGLQRETQFKLTTKRYDGREAFGAYVDKSIFDKDGAIILLNVEGTVGACLEMNRDPDVIEVIIETLMHEFGHALEDLFKLEFNEDRIEGIVEGFRKINNW